EFLTQATDPFLAVKTCTEELDAAGFVKLSKREPFGGVLKPGGSYYYTINHSTLVAFTVGAKYKAGNGFKIIGGHTDSPYLKVKPISKRAGSGCVQLGVECYGGGLWHTWFDRDLGISGRVLVRTSCPESEQHIVRIPKPVARISTLCIHLQTAEERGSFKVNKEEHLSPILGTQSVLEREAKLQLNKMGDDDDHWKKNQEPELLKLIASEIGIDTKQIANFELGLFDCQPASLGGIKNEFLNSARLDNLATCFVALESIVDYSKSDNVSEDDAISLIALFDHEEIGSQSTHGAGSPVMSEAVSRITSAFAENTHSRDPELHASAVRRSFIFSVDMAHAVHPNYANKHERNHGPRMNAGVVIKTNQNQRYATNGVTGFIAREVARKTEKNIPLQEFVVRSDCPCGTTIGPILSANTGIRTVDLGMPQLSMHSCREVMGIADLTNGYNLFKSFFDNFNEIDECLEG
ncbi:probable aspartyl aminopeptidase, partial [Thalassiosira pseudonana CCMP1335]